MLGSGGGDVRERLVMGFGGGTYRGRRWVDVCARDIMPLGRKWMVWGDDMVDTGCWM